jgi:predicted nucleic acid-binding protein
VRTFVIDASVAIKWVVEEEGTAKAIALRSGARLLAPDQLAVECANILWKKTTRGELTSAEASFAAELLEHCDVELIPMRGLMREAMRIALAISHPAYDCVYVALALANQSRLVTADLRLVRKLGQLADATLAASVVSLMDAPIAP